MTEFQIDTKGLDEAIKKLSETPQKLNRMMKTGMESSLYELKANVPEYPPPPPESKYRRTGTLSRSLGVGAAKPTVYSITGTGGNIQGRFGTNLSYAKYVISPDQQAYMHKGRWWTMYVIRDKAYAKIKQIWEAFVRQVLK